MRLSNDESGTGMKSKSEHDTHMKALAITVLLTLLLAMLMGCSEYVYIGERGTNTLLTVHVTNGPIEGNTVSYQVHSNRVTFFWEGKDPTDSPWNYQDVESVRYFCKQYYGYSVDDMNRDPGRFESWWSPWISKDAPGDSGLTTIAGNDEFLQIGRDYIFAVQAMDDAGAISSVFSNYNNVRHFFVMEPTGSLITYYEPVLGSGNFLGTNYTPKVYAMSAGFPMTFSWSGDASMYGEVVQSYRYGWDVADVNDPAEWNCSPSPYVKSAPNARFYSGVHTQISSISSSCRTVI